MDIFSISEAVEMAIQTERLGYQFYTAMAEKFKEDEAFYEFFSLLARKELSHEEIFKGLKEKADADASSSPEPEGWEEAQMYFRAMVESEFFLGSGKSLPSLDFVTDIRGAVDFAIGFEKETLLFFVGLKSVAKDIETLGSIIDEEISHITWLVKYRAEL